LPTGQPLIPGKTLKSIVVVCVLGFWGFPNGCMLGKTLKSMVVVGFWGFPKWLLGGQDYEINGFSVLWFLGFFPNGRLVGKH
jgi:hypothetical protein